jgi:hypothetical protein
MNLVAMTIPDDPAKLSVWLEQQLVGLDLGQLVAELSIIHGPPARPASSVRDLLGNHLDDVVQRGLRVLPALLLKRLLNQPHLLLELQEIVLCASSPYWDRVTRPDELEPMVEKGWQQLRKKLPLASPAPFRPRARRWQTWVSGMLAAAAVLLFGVFVYPLFKPIFAPSESSTIAWGWAKPGALPHDVGAADYLRALAEGARQWFQQRPEGAAAVARRIEEMGQGCRILIAANHAPLNEEDKAWLVERCRNWSKQFDDLHAKVENGEDPSKVREQMDAAIDRLSETLRKRAALRTAFDRRSRFEASGAA